MIGLTEIGPTGDDLLILSIDDDQNTVLRRGGGWLSANKLSETLGGHSVRVFDVLCSARAILPLRRQLLDREADCSVPHHIVTSCCEIPLARLFGFTNTELA